MFPVQGWTWLKIWRIIDVNVAISFAIGGLYFFTVSRLVLQGWVVTCSP